MDQFKNKDPNSHIVAARYEKGLLEVDFRRKGTDEVDTYVYDGPPAQLWKQFKAAVSKGTFLHKHIIKDVKNPRFKGIRKEKHESTSNQNR